MSKKKGSAEKSLKPGRDNSRHNARVAMWGPFADKRYDEVRELVEGWFHAPTYEKVIKTPRTTRPSLFNAVVGPSKRLHLHSKLRQLSDRTIAWIRDVVKKGDFRSIRDFADVLEHLHSASRENPETGSPDVLFLTLHVATKPADYKFTFREVRDFLAEVIGLKPPYDEAFEQRIRRIAKMIGLKLWSKTG